ncbi:receptor kinase-like protein Xa21 [Capsicum annuum]|uniref:receptor kinase-like protein Xa21 n=1 Tax=Capsicum annuum TaxID=4072 RepID=UPI001FB0FC82|nr:receptor kinase-like protein Xa21 [Capsicum annuum]
MLPASTGNLSTSLRTFVSDICKIKGDLQRFNLSSNKVTGFIGDHICKLQHLGDIYLDQNQLSGSLPNCLGNITSLREIHLGSNKLSSNIPTILGNLQDLVVLDLSSNNMVGSLPPEIVNRKAATLIDLSMNQFSNGIPTEIGGLQNLANLSLTHKKLQGALPDSMSNMVGLEFQDLSHNNISGIIPKSLEKLQNLKYFNVSVNKLYRRGKSAPQQAESLSTVTRERISHYELLQATDDLSESNLIGFGSFVSVYKGVLRSGTSIAVKVFNLQLDAAFKSFDTESDVLCSLRHRNLVKEYLHHGCSLPVNHCDVKPSNILLDEDMVAHLSDFVISKLLGEDQGDLYTKTLATLGNIAREYGLNGLVSTKCDVYSYGIMFLETFTRRKPYEFEGDLSLKHWVSYSLPEEVMDVVDVNFVTPIGNLLQKELDVVASIMKVALDCCAECPAKRTNMKDIVAMLQKVKIQLLAC